MAGSHGDDWELGDNPTVDPGLRVLATAPERSDRQSVGRERYARRAFAAGLFVFLALGLAGVFGVWTTSSSATGGGYHVRVSHARVTRPGLATPFAIEVSRADGSPLREPVTLAVSSSYLAMFDDNGMDPQPSSETAGPDQVVWEFEPPPEADGDALVVTLDARLEPAVQWGRDGFVRLMDGSDVAAEVRFHTWVAP
jgi:hypothetical protein